MDYQIIVVMAALGLTALSADARANSIFDRQTSRADEINADIDTKTEKEIVR